MRRTLAIAVVVVGCTTASGDDVETARRPSDDASADAAERDSSSIFPVEDTAPVEEDASAAIDTGAAMDTAVVEDTTSTLTVTVDTLECRTIICPLTHPYVVGCNVTMGGASSIACAANVTTGRTIVFKEGQSCGDISVRGTVTCSTAAGSGLTRETCVMNKPTPLYVSTLSACPT